MRMSESLMKEKLMAQKNVASPAIFFLKDMIYKAAVGKKG